LSLIPSRQDRRACSSLETAGVSDFGDCSVRCNPYSRDGWSLLRLKSFTRQPPYKQRNRRGDRQSRSATGGDHCSDGLGELHAQSVLAAAPGAGIYGLVGRIKAPKFPTLNVSQVTLYPTDEIKRRTVKCGRPECDCVAFEPRGLSRQASRECQSRRTHGRCVLLTSSDGSGSSSRIDP
jgi:hypothetical protein